MRFFRSGFRVFTSCFHLYNYMESDLGLSTDYFNVRELSFSKACFIYSECFLRPAFWAPFVWGLLQVLMEVRLSD